MKKYVFSSRLIRPDDSCVAIWCKVHKTMTHAARDRLHAANMTERFQRGIWICLSLYIVCSTISEYIQDEICTKNHKYFESNGLEIYLHQGQQTLPIQVILQEPLQRYRS